MSQTSVNYMNVRCACTCKADHSVLRQCLGRWRRGSPIEIYVNGDTAEMGGRAHARPRGRAARGVVKTT
jgi:hypothetical protein